jgi:small subunit ribosomal protein S13
MRIVGITIPDAKRIGISLRYVYGIGPFRAKYILASTGVDPNKMAKDLTTEEVNQLQSFIENNFKVEGELRQLVRQNVGRLKDIKCYRGTRHTKRLPVHGQRTKTNSRTVRGNVRKTAGSGKRKIELK